MTQKPEQCGSVDCGNYPHYGVAPHECFWRKPGGFEKNPLGTSTVLPADTWPDSFMMEIDEGDNPLEMLTWGACGIYYCPACKTGMPKSNSATLWSPHLSEQKEPTQ